MHMHMHDAEGQVCRLRVESISTRPFSLIARVCAVTCMLTESFFMGDYTHVCSDIASG